MTNKKEEDKKEKFKLEWRIQDLLWVIGILIASLIFVINFRLGDNLEVVNLFSLISSSVSIALALIAIYIAFKQDSDNKVVNESIRSILQGIVSDVGSVKNSVDKLTSTEIDEMAQHTIEDVNVDDKQPNYTADEVKNIVEEAVTNFSKSVKTKVENTNNSKYVVNSLINYQLLKRQIQEIANKKNGLATNPEYIQNELREKHGIELDLNTILKILLNPL